MFKLFDEPLITNPAVVFGILMIILALIFKAANDPQSKAKSFFNYIPALLLCYFIPSLLSTFGIVDPDAPRVKAIAEMAKLYLLPASLVLFTLSIDFKGIINLGPKALIMFLTASAGIILGGPLAILLISLFNPDLVGGVEPNEVWRGLTTVAGSWIGGSANQVAMKATFEVSDKVYSAMLTIDVLISNFWMAILLFAAGRSKEIDAALGADTSAIDALKLRLENFQEKFSHVPTFTEIMTILAIGFGVTAIAHVGGDTIAPWITENLPSTKNLGLTSGFFWIVVIATSGGLILSLTKYNELEGAGASRIGSVFLYILVATIGMKMDLGAIFEDPGLFAIGAIWMGFHAILLIVVAKLIKAPVFFLAVGSQANVGGAASAPVVASAFHPALAPVGVLLAVLGYALGTYGAIVCAYLMQIAAP